MVLVMSTLMNMELVNALNPLYAIPIVAVILCAFIVFTFGFKSPVQPPSFDAIDEEKKSAKKRKTKESSKVKVIQNGKANGNTLNKNQVLISAKKKESEKAISADKPSTEKPLNEKKLTKKSKSSNERKAVQEKKKESFSLEDAGEDGWVQLISKKGRKNRKKDEVTNIEKQTCSVKRVQSLQNDKVADVTLLSAETPNADDVENSISEKKLALKDDVNEIVPNIDSKEKIVILEDCKSVDINIEKAAFEESAIKNEKISDEAITKSKKKKKKSTDVNTNSNNIMNSVSSAEQVISEVSASVNSTNNSPITVEASEILIRNVEEHHSKEMKTSNVVFDELAGLYPEPKEQRKKKRVRRDH